MVITPSATGSIVSGVGVSCIGWSLIEHIEAIPVIGRFVQKDRIYSWVNKNRVLTLTMTEVANFAVHGVSNPLGAFMALGGTCINASMIFGFIPWRQKRKYKRELGHVILGN